MSAPGTFDWILSGIALLVITSIRWFALPY